MTATTKTRPGVTLRSNYGSLSKVVCVIAYDPAYKCATVKFSHGGIETVPLSELEAFDANRRYVSLEEVVRDMAEEVIGE